MALNFPNNPSVGDIYEDSTSGFSYQWDGTFWKSYKVEISGSLGGNLDADLGLNSNDITGTGDVDTTGNLKISGIATASSFVKESGTSSQFLKADGSVDSSTYITASGDVTITSTDTGSSAGPELTLYRNSASPAPGDYLGQLMFKGENSNGGEENYAKITGKISDETLGTEDGLIETAIKGDGSFVIVSRQRSDELQLINGVGLSVDGTISGNLTGDVTGNITGVAATFSGDVSIGGTLTYEDVTNVDSVGLITARSGIHVTSGSVGIEAPSPSGKLDIRVNTSPQRDIIAGYTAGSPMFTYRNGSGSWFHAGKHPTDDGFVVTSGATTTSSELLRIDSSGNVGIGQTSPSYKLDLYRTGSGIVSRFGKDTIFGEFHVAGEDVAFQGTRSSDSAVTGFFIKNPSNTGTSNFDHVTIKTTGSERMRIDSGGIVYMRHPTTTSLIVATGAAASGSNPVFAVRRSSTTITTGTNVFFVYANGSYATISDQSQKKNIESTRDGYLDDLNRLRVVKYNWNEQEDTDPKELGLIAQEVEQVFPGLISEMTEDGEETTKGIKYSVLPVMLLKALQEASAKIETLEAKVAALEKGT